MLIKGLQHLDPELRSLVQAEMAAAEQLVWADRPVPKFFAGSSIGMFVFGLVWTSFSIFWVVSAFFGTRQLGKGMAESLFQNAFPLFGVPFVLIGFGMLSAPWWMFRSLKRTVYAITDRRAIVFRPGWFGARRVQSFEPSRLTSMERIERTDGSGDLIFEQFTTRQGSGSTTTRHGFMSCPRVRDVDELIRQTLLRDRARTDP